MWCVGFFLKMYLPWYFTSISCSSHLLCTGLAVQMYTRTWICEKTVFFFQFPLSLSHRIHLWYINQCLLDLLQFLGKASWELPSFFPFSGLQRFFWSSGAFAKLPFCTPKKNTHNNPTSKQFRWKASFCFSQQKHLFFHKSLNYPCWRDQTKQMLCDFEGFNPPKEIVHIVCVG